METISLKNRDNRSYVLNNIIQEWIDEIGYEEYGASFDYDGRYSNNFLDIHVVNKAEALMDLELFIENHRRYDDTNFFMVS